MAEIDGWPMPVNTMAEKAGRRTAILANAEIRSFAENRTEGGATWEFFCLCGCMTLVSMRIAAYDAIGGGVWAPGHRA